MRRVSASKRSPLRNGVIGIARAQLVTYRYARFPVTPVMAKDYYRTGVNNKKK
jgi:hypothetical protein